MKNSFLISKNNFKIDLYNKNLVSFELTDKNLKNITVERIDEKQLYRKIFDSLDVQLFDQLINEFDLSKVDYNSLIIRYKVISYKFTNSFLRNRHDNICAMLTKANLDKERKEIILDFLKKNN